MKARFLALFLTILALVGPHSTAYATTWHLNPSGPLTIQDAIDGAADGDTILLLSGTYTGPGNRAVDFLGKQVVLTSVEGPDSTVIDCEQQSRAFVFQGGEGPETVLSGITIKNGWQRSDTSRGTSGGAILILDSSPTIVGNTFSMNRALCRHVWNGSWVSCLSGYGGAIYVRSGSPLIAYNQFASNECGFGHGGAVCLRDSDAAVVGNTFIGNVADQWCCSFDDAVSDTPYGGAVYARNGSVSFINNIFHANSAIWYEKGEGRGQAICLEGGNHVVRYCTFAGGVWWQLGVDAILIRGGTVLIENSIFAFYDYAQSVFDRDVIECVGGVTLTVNCSDFFANGTDTFCADNSYGNVFLDPMFVDYANDDLTLLPGSPCLPENNSCQVLMGAAPPRLYSTVDHDTVQVDSQTVVCATFYLVPPVEGTEVSFEVSGANSGTGSGIVDSAGSVEWCYPVASLGTDTITAAATTFFAGTHSTTSARLVRTLLSEVPVYVQHYGARWVGDHVEVSWSLLDAGSDLTFDVYRKEAPQEPYARMWDPGITRIEKSYSFEDRSASRGKTYTYRVLILESGEVVAAFETTVLVPSAAFALQQNSPNPFFPSTKIRYEVPPGGGMVTIKVYDVKGRFVRTLVNGVETEGEKEVTWFAWNQWGKRVASGVYFYRMTAPGFDKTRKMILLR